jgi:hypothetical protein
MRRKMERSTMGSTMMRNRKTRRIMMRNMGLRLAVVMNTMTRRMMKLRRNKKRTKNKQIKRVRKLRRKSKVKKKLSYK